MGRNKLAQLPAECRELGDAIRADPIYADASQDSPIVRIVGGPRDDFRAGRVCPLDQLLVDERNFLPEIPRSGRHESRHGIDVAAGDQDSSSQGGEDALHRFDDTMVESVDRAVRSGFPDAPDNERLDVLRLDLDVYHSSIANGIENRVQGGDIDSLRQRKASKVGC